MQKISMYMYTIYSIITQAYPLDNYSKSLSPDWTMEHLEDVDSDPKHEELESMEEEEYDVLIASEHPHDLSQEYL